MIPKPMPPVNVPNVTVPLVTSYNSRGITGYTNTITNGVDQRKINSVYEPIQNAGSRDVTYYLVKRPGVTDTGSSYGTTGQVAWLWDVAPGATTTDATNRWVFNTSGSDVRASDSSSTTIILTAANSEPVYWDKTFITAIDTGVLQIRNNSTLAQRVFYSTTIGTWTEIVDTDFTTLSHVGKMEFLNGRGYVASRLGSRIYNSDLNSLSAWSATSFITKQVQQDISTGLARFGDQIICFGNATMEIFRDAGNPTGSSLEAQTSLFQRVGVPIQSASGQRHYYTTLDKWMFFRGGNPVGIYAWDGQKLEKVSSPAIDKIFFERTVMNMSTLNMLGQRAVVISLDTPSATTQRMLLFFPDWKDWFEWNSTTFVPVTSNRSSTIFLGAGTNGHKLYQISSTENYQDNGTNYQWAHQFQLPKEGNGRDRMTMFGVEGDTARTAQSLSVEFSDDDYQTFQTARTIDLTSVDKQLYHCGSYRTPRVIRLSYTGANSLRLKHAIARVN